MLEDEILGWLRGIAGFGSPFLELSPDSKRTRLPWCCYEHQTGEYGLGSALRWLGRGGGVGMLPKSPLWVLDADSAAQVARITDILLDARIIPLSVKTPSGGAHFYFLLPTDFPCEGLKNHLCHPGDADDRRMDADFKFGPRTLLVAPGTVRAGKRYEPVSPWTTPPTVDPRTFLPWGRFWREQRPFLVDERPLRDRKARACAYLKSRAPVSISGRSGRKTLTAVAVHLVRFLGLDPGLAHHLMTHGKHPWNTRCRYQDGTPFPWQDCDLWSACTTAVDAIPAAGVRAFERMQVRTSQKARLALLVGFLKAVRTRPESERVPVSVVLETFRRAGLPDLTATALGDELVAQGIKRVQATRKHVWCVPGLDLLALQLRITEADRIPETREGRTECSALMKRIGA